MDARQVAHSVLVQDDRPGELAEEKVCVMQLGDTIQSDFVWQQCKDFMLVTQETLDTLLMRWSVVVNYRFLHCNQHC